MATRLGALPPIRPFGDLTVDGTGALVAVGSVVNRRAARTTVGGVRSDSAGASF